MAGEIASSATCCSSVRSNGAAATLWVAARGAAPIAINPRRARLFNAALAPSISAFRSATRAPVAPALAIALSTSRCFEPRTPSMLAPAEMRAIEQRPRLENFEDGLQLSGRKPFADLGDHSRQLTRAQRREHAMPRLDTPIERRRNRIRQRFESARRPDDHNIGLHPDSLCAAPKPAARLQLTPRASDAASRQAADSRLCPID